MTLRAAIAACFLFFATAIPVAAQDVRRFSDQDLIDGFVRTVFGAEDGQPTEASFRVKRFTGPVRLHILPVPSDVLPAAAARARAAEARAIIARLQTRISGVRFVFVDSPARANVLLVITDTRNYHSVGARVLDEGWEFIRATICAGKIAWDQRFVIRRAAAIVVADRGPALFQACVAEEVLQVLGPVNDQDDLIHSTFNDATDLGGFPLFDQFILNMLYHPLVRPGMTEDQARRVLPRVIAEIRPRMEAAVARRIGPNGRAGYATTGVVWD